MKKCLIIKSITHKVSWKLYIEWDKKLLIYFKKLILMKKLKNYKPKKLWKILKPYIKMEKTIIKFGDMGDKTKKLST